MCSVCQRIASLGQNQLALWNQNTSQCNWPFNSDSKRNPSAFHQPSSPQTPCIRFIFPHPNADHCSLICHKSCLSSAQPEKHVPQLAHLQACEEHAKGATSLGGTTRRAALGGDVTTAPFLLGRGQRAGDRHASQAVGRPAPGQPTPPAVACPPAQTAAAARGPRKRAAASCGVQTGAGRLRGRWGLEAPRPGGAPLASGSGCAASCCRGRASGRHACWKGRRGRRLRGQPRAKPVPAEAWPNNVQRLEIGIRQGVQPGPAPAVAVRRRRWAAVCGGPAPACRARLRLPDTEHIHRRRLRQNGHGHRSPNPRDAAARGLARPKGGRRHGQGRGARGRHNLGLCRQRRQLPLLLLLLIKEGVSRAAPAGGPARRFGWQALADLPACRHCGRPTPARSSAPSAARLISSTLAASMRAQGYAQPSTTTAQHSHPSTAQHVAHLHQNLKQ